jgi:hypothetical protein
MVSLSLIIVIRERASHIYMVEHRASKSTSRRQAERSSALTSHGRQRSRGQH